MTKFTHGLFKVDGKKSNLYSIWEGIKYRCNNPNCKRFKDYGGRGIKVFEGWSTYLPFHEWAISNGYEIGLTIDRKDNDGNYEPDNCRWATQKQQGNNRRTNVLVTLNGITKTRQQWSDEMGFGKHVLKNRLKRGWAIERALTEPLNK